MKNSLTVIIFVLLLTVVPGCTYHSHKAASMKDPNGVWISMKDTAAMAQINMNRIDRGMTKAAVLEIMGTKTHYGVRPYHRTTTVPHPYKREFVNYNGIDYEVLYYYTYYVRGDKALTPIVLKDDKVVGWGWTYFRTLDRNSK